MYFFQVRVDVTGEETGIVFEKVLTNLARTAPPVPGFRRQKGGNHFIAFNESNCRLLIKLLNQENFDILHKPSQRIMLYLFIIT